MAATILTFPTRKALAPHQTAARSALGSRYGYSDLQLRALRRLAGEPLATPDEKHLLDRLVELARENGR